VTPQSRDGFVDVDKGILDSIKDIQEEIGGSKTLMLAPEASWATIVLTVVGRRVSSVNEPVHSFADPQQSSVGTVVVCYARAETPQPFGIVLSKIGGVNAERLSY